MLVAVTAEVLAGWLLTLLCIISIIEVSTYVESSLVYLSYYKALNGDSPGG